MIEVHILTEADVPAMVAREAWTFALACGYLIAHDLLERTCIVCRTATASTEDLLLGGYVCGPICYAARWKPEGAR